jgi:hypothetical protein
MEHIIAITIASISGCGWFMSKVFGRMRTLEDRIDRLPLEYVLKQDYIREMERMNDEFGEINNKLDKLVEKLLAK